jgi:hypothetical protein
MPSVKLVAAAQIVQIAREIAGKLPCRPRLAQCRLRQRGRWQADVRFPQRVDWQCRHLEELPEHLGQICGALQKPAPRTSERAVYPKEYLVHHEMSFYYRTS